MSEPLWSAPRTHSVPPKILIADDEPAELQVIAQVLAQSGFDVTTAISGPQALDAMARQQFDVILTDVGMPGMSGVALLRAVRARDLEIPVLLMTGAPDGESASAALRYGAFDYLTKPVTTGILQQAIQRAADMSRLARTKRDAIREMKTGRPQAGDLAGLEVTLDRALDSLWMAYQPIVNATSQTIYGYESLLRSDEPALPQAAAVLDAAAHLHRLDEVGRAVRLQAPGPMGRVPDAVLFVNLHPSDLNDASLLSPTAPLSAIASRVVLELTERESLDSVDHVREKVAQLRAMGFRIALDDFGAGYAGLSTFAQLEPDFVKLDISLVRNVHENTVKQKLVRSMTNLCQDMGILVVAEGIELPQERDAMIDMKCAFLQGFLFAKADKAFPTLN